MNTAQLNYFLSAAKHLSFSEAAKEFYMTQPAISHQISDLEKELGGGEAFLPHLQGSSADKGR